MTSSPEPESDASLPEEDVEKFHAKERQLHALSYRPPGVGGVVESLQTLHFPDTATGDPDSITNTSLWGRDPDPNPNQRGGLSANDDQRSRDFDPEDHRTGDVSPREVTGQVTSPDDECWREDQPLPQCTSDQPVPRCLLRFLNRVNSKYGEQMMQSLADPRRRGKAGNDRGEAGSDGEETQEGAGSPGNSAGKNKHCKKQDGGEKTPRRQNEKDRGEGRMEKEKQEDQGMTEEEKRRARKKKVNSILGRGIRAGGGEDQKPGAKADIDCDVEEDDDYQRALKRLEELKAVRDQNKVLQNWIRFHLQGAGGEDVTSELNRMAGTMGRYGRAATPGGGVKEEVEDGGSTTSRMVEKVYRASSRGKEATKPVRKGFRGFDRLRRAMAVREGTGSRCEEESEESEEEVEDEVEEESDSDVTESPRNAVDVTDNNSCWQKVQDTSKPPYQDTSKPPDQDTGKSPVGCHYEETDELPSLCQLKKSCESPGLGTGKPPIMYQLQDTDEPPVQCQLEVYDEAAELSD